MNTDGIWLAEKWVEQLGAAIGSMTGAEARAARVETSETAGPGPGDLKWMQPVNAAPHAAIWLVFSQSVWKGLGRQVLEAAGLEGSDEAEIRSTSLEILQQSLSPLSSAMGARLQREVSFENGELAEAAAGDLEWHTVEITIGGDVLGKAWLAGNSSLLASLEPEKEVEPPPTPSLIGSARRTSPTMELLMEVELPVGVSFGRAQMRLKDAVKLTTGSIVELNRSVTEPVEVLVNNCVIARGEVVVVEGNYGVRIRQIVSREERLRTLF